MNRRVPFALAASVGAARAALAAAGASRARITICTFSCHLHWKAVADGQPGTKFSDARSFYDYARSLGAEGVQTGLRKATAEEARLLRQHVEATGGVYEADVKLPREASEVAAFEAEVRLAREAGATVARAVLMSGRRYEVFKSLAAFQEFCARGQRSLELAEPALRRHRLKLALENHKDQTVPELTGLLRRLSSEWIGALVDTGNNIALLEEPHAVVEGLAPFAMSVHLKDMAVQPAGDGFLLSEVPCGTGFLDLPRIVATLRRANPGICFNLEMATRDPLRVPCLAPDYWPTFPDRPAADLAAALALVKAHPPMQPPPRIQGKPLAAQLAEEEANNRDSLAWMKAHLA